MSQIPRRTSEFQASSVKQQTRSSRVTNSALRPSAISTNRVSAVRASTANRVPATPMRTPSRTPNKSTGTKDRMTVVQMTAEKEKAPIEDRDYIHMKTNQILHELSKQDRFNELVQKGLKSMTLKTFIAILEYFLEPIYGTVPKDFQANYVDFLYNLLIQLEYPYNINKSSLKTPNAPHCLNNIIILLGWLADFSRTDDENIQYTNTEELPDLESMNIFMEQTSEAYKLFNDEKDYSHLESKIRETYFEVRTGTGTNIESEMERIKYEIEQLNKESKPLSLLKELNEKKEELKGLDIKLESHNKNIGEHNRKITNLKTQLGYKQQALDNIQKELKLLDHQLKTQKMDLEKRQQIIIEITNVKSALLSKRNAVMDLTEANSENEIMLSNLISKKFQLIDRLNNLLYKFSSDLNIAGGTQLDPEIYEIKSTNDAVNMEKQIQKIHKALTELKNKYYQMQSEMKDKTIKIESEMHRCKTQNEMLSVKYQQLLKTLQQVKDEEAVTEDTLSTMIHSIQINFQERKEKIKQNEKDIAERTKNLQALEDEVKKLAEDRKVFGRKAVDEVNKLYLERKNEVEARRAYLREQIEILDSYHPEPIPDELQSLYDEFEAKAEKTNLN